MTVKSAEKTTFAQGPAQPAGGVKARGLLEKSAKACSERRVTEQGFVEGSAWKVTG